MWWPGLSRQVSGLVEYCPECAKGTTPNKEPLIPTPLSEYLLQKVGSDLFTLNGDNYLLLMDYFSWYPEVVMVTHDISGCHQGNEVNVCTVQHLRDCCE